MLVTSLLWKSQQQYLVLLGAVVPILISRVYKTKGVRKNCPVGQNFSKIFQCRKEEMAGYNMVLVTYNFEDHHKN